MRLLGRCLLLLLLVAVGAFLYQPFRALFQLPPPAPALVEQLGLSARPATVFFLPEDDWLTFPVISQASRLRILTHAGATPGAPVDVPMRYVLEYELQDARGDPLHEATYVHQTRLPLPQFKGGQPVPRNLYTDRDLVVAAGQSINIQLDALPRTAFVRLRLKPLAPPLENVAVRVYYEERMAESEAAVAWERLSQAKRVRLAQGAIYPPELLTQQERLNLLKRQWQPVGPLGARPAQGTLFNIQGADTVLDPGLMPRPPGLYVAPDRVGILPIETAGEYLIRFSPVLPVEHLPALLHLQLFGEQFEPPRDVRVPLAGEPLSATRVLSAGLAVVRPNQPGILDMRPLASPDQSVLPESRYLRAWALQPALAVAFSLLPVDDVGTSLRIDLRAHGAGEPLPAARDLQASYRLLDAEGRILEAGELNANVAPSMIDRVADTQAIADLSEPASFFLRLPRQASRIELMSQQRLLVNAYTRPDDLPHRTRVPQDYHAWRGDAEAQPSWFILQPAPGTLPAEPENADAGSADELSAPADRLVAEPERSLVLHIQSRPPERDAELLAGRYGWEALEPQLQARGAYILVPMRGEEQLRASGLPAYFKPLRQGVQTVEVQAPGVARALQPQLVYLRDDAAPFTLRLRIGGETVRHELIGRRGTLRLPALTPGRHDVELQASAAALWLMNYRYPDASGYLRRMAFRLDASPLRYPVEKRDDGQLVGARFYSLGAPGTESTLRVRVLGPVPASGPTREWTHLERRYHVAPPDEEARVGYVLGQQHERLSHGQPILMNLGSDLPNGRLNVEFSLLAGAPGYLVFHEIRPGLHERASGFHQELE